MYPIISLYSILVAALNVSPGIIDYKIRLAMLPPKIRHSCSRVSFAETRGLPSTNLSSCFFQGTYDLEFLTGVVHFVKHIYRNPVMDLLKHQMLQPTLRVLRAKPYGNTERRKQPGR